jgi:hypothetical protein
MDPDADDSALDRKKRIVDISLSEAELDKRVLDGRVAALSLAEATQNASRPWWRDLSWPIVVAIWEP